MTQDADRNGLQQELRGLEERLAALHRQLDELREDLRDYDDSPTATGLLFEQQALIEALEARRSELREQLGEG
ncbi:MAG TPA: hypothetical protein VE623_21780 [Acidimicrobiales bacterium]|jgi:chromosome segregation ATPase|nr:hypothetical protein [Acidimicrobiales bacterium]